MTEDRVVVFSMRPGSPGWDDKNGVYALTFHSPETTHVQPIPIGALQESFGDVDIVDTELQGIHYCTEHPDKPVAVRVSGLSKRLRFILRSLQRNSDPALAQKPPE